MVDLVVKITNYKIQITNKSQITMSEITNKKTKAVMVCIDAFTLQIMTAFYEKLLRGVQGGRFSRKEPPWPPEALKISKG